MFWNRSTLLLVFVSALLAIALAAGCSPSQTVQFSAGSAGTGATGKVRTEARDNLGMVPLHVDVENLTPPGELIERGKYYTLWAIDEGGKAESLGSLNLLDGKRGALIAQTKAKKIRLSITAEWSEEASKPSDKEILKTEMITLE